jgi:hypothetical protein
MGRTSVTILRAKVVGGLQPFGGSRASGEELDSKASSCIRCLGTGMILKHKLIIKNLWSICRGPKVPARESERRQENRFFKSDYNNNNDLFLI